MNKFIEKAKKIHNNKYDYSLIEYINSKTKVKIICPEHGIFEQEPGNHSFKQGCPICSNKNMSTNIFIEKAKKIHNNKYDYSLIEYINSKTKVKIICPEHGIFEQKPNTHLTGRNCNKCANTIRGFKKKLNLDEFIEKAQLIHGNKYDYSLVEYINSQAKVKIICSKHGIFEQKPNTHIFKKSGCQNCSLENSSINQRLNINLFMEKAKQIHNNKYDYSLVEYKNMHVKIKIICPEHGIFEQEPSNHIGKKYGCPYCKESKGEKEISELLNNNNINYKRQKTFNDCKNKNVLPFDFYLPRYNVCIEYDGEQHFNTINYFGGKKGLKYIQNNDGIKTQYCKDNNITLIRIKYNENILEKLNEEFKKFSQKIS